VSKITSLMISFAMLTTLAMTCYAFSVLSELHDEIVNYRVLERNTYTIPFYEYEGVR